MTRIATLLGRELSFGEGARTSDGRAGTSGLCLRGQRRVRVAGRRQLQSSAASDFQCREGCCARAELDRRALDAEPVERPVCDHAG